MRVPVVWKSYADTPARGYWDQTLIESLLARTWRVPAGPTFTHHDGFGGLSPFEGCVLVMPGHGGDDAAAAARAETHLRVWLLLIVTSDEERRFPWWQIDHPNMAVWTVFSDPASPWQPDLVLPLGWIPGTREWAARRRLPPEREWAWTFAGQINHERRRACVDRLDTLNRQGDHDTAGRLYTTSGFAEGLSQDDYLTMLASGLEAPCPAGNVRAETFRTYEALEVAAVPVLDGTSPAGDVGYWPRVLGDHPLRQVDEWVDYQPDPTADSIRVQAWWQRLKRDLAWRLADTIGQLHGEGTTVGVDDEISVLVSTSPIPSHPDTSIIEQTIRSVRDQLPHAEIVVACDGVRPEQAHLEDQYDEYLRRLMWLSNHHWVNVLPVYDGEWRHQAGTVSKLALPLLRSRLVLFVEHDTPLQGDIPWRRLAELVTSEEWDVVRFHHETNIPQEHRYLMGRMVNDPTGIRLTETRQWSQRPHLARTGWYRDMLAGWFPHNARTMIEDRIHGPVANQELPVRVGVYTPHGSIKRSGHLNGRASESKFEETMSW